MGVLNVTPDSFSDGGKFHDIDDAIAHGAAMVEAGADIIDIGGESTRPEASPVCADEELRRVLPVILALSKHVISIDTTKALVAEAALATGAQIVNDISALRADPRMVKVVQGAGAGLVLMHMQGTPETMQQNPKYTDVVAEVGEFLAERIRFARSQGVKKSQIAVDPGIGFGKTVNHNLQLLAKIESFQALGCPILAGTSRKSFIGKQLGREPHERIWGTAATVAWAVAHGVGIVRVHDVAEMRDVVRMVEAIQAAKKTK